tara:strand:- start:22207 stop:22569 length:363 start_codon:yes stop_codon:yes gene_type:complete
MDQFIDPNARPLNPTIRLMFIAHDGVEHEVVSPIGQTLMQAAVNNDIPGIDAICGGDRACATCQVYVDDQWLEALPEPTVHEQAMVRYMRRPAMNSRLSCAIELAAVHDGLTVRIPQCQY